MNTLILLAGTIILIAGLFIGYIVRKMIAKNQVGTAEEKVNRLLDDAKIKAKEQILDAKGKGVKILDEVKREESKRRGAIQQKEDRLEQKEQKIDQKISKIIRSLFVHFLRRR